MPKVSRYNHFFPWTDGHYLAFNALKGSLAMMTDENYATYCRLAEQLSNGSATDMSEAESELMSQLQYGGYLVNDEDSELDSLKYRYRKFRYDESSLGLVIAPTMACNMACEYCFEENKSGRMTPRVVESILTFVEKRAPRLDRLDTTWYGGEPLLAIDILEDINESLVDLAEEYNFAYSCGGVITNGYLLDRAMTDRLVRMRVGEVQITIDGPARIHNAKRPLKNGRNSFEAIIDNMKYACEKLPVVVRINVDKSIDRDMIDELLTELDDAGLRERVAVYLGQLEPVTTVCSNIAESCYESRSFSEQEIEYYSLLLQRGFMVQKLPSPIVTFCFAQRVSSFLIDPAGELYRCFNYAGDVSKSMGNVREEINLEHPEFMRMFAFDPFEDEDCRTCGILPMCMGSCPARRADRPIDKAELCDTWKYNLEPMLELVAGSRQQQARSAANRAAQEARI